jgi:cytochrome c
MMQKWIRFGKYIGVAIGILFFAIFIAKKFSTQKPETTTEISTAEVDEALDTDLGRSNHLIEAADVVSGQAISMACVACHSMVKTEPNKLGPNLFGIAGARIARKKKYVYSEALKKLSDKYWTIDNLDEWLKDPESFAPGNKMSLEGLSDPQDRMDLIAYLKTLK